MVPPQPLIQTASIAPTVPVIPPQPQQLIITQQPTALTQQPVSIGTGFWVVSAEDKAKADALFQLTDADKDGFVSGMEIKDVFLQSGVPQQVLAHIWLVKLISLHLVD